MAGNSIHSLHSCSLFKVSDKHAEIFKKGLGTLKCYQAKIYTPRFLEVSSEDQSYTPAKYTLYLTLCNHWLTKI